MSYTSLLEAHSSERNGFQTPTKRKRHRFPQESGEPRVQLDNVPKGSSNADIWKWVFSSEAIASCFVRDIVEMRQHEAKDEQYYWIGNVPCRSVRIVGMIVGVQRYEKKVVYTVDDGTSVIDCIHKAQALVAPSPKKGKSASVNPPLAKAIAYIGASIRVTGRVQEFYESRQIIVESIEKCSSPNEEPLHWRTVLGLHKSKYSSTAPFVVPELAPALILSNAGSPSRPAPSASVSPSHPILISSTAPSPTKSVASSQRSPEKLRHPSRLHSQDLTANTFRIYIKHYMDNPPPYSDPDTDSSDHEYNSSYTPTKRSRTPFNKAVSSRYNADPDETPRPSRPFPSKSQPSARNKMDVADPQLRGFTLSFLRRVPELSEMARRVCKAETKRRDREARKKAKQAGSNPSRSRTQTTQPSTSKPVSATVLDKENSIHARMKRLFQYAIVQLLREGSIVLWNSNDGPTYPYSMLEEENAHHASLWRYSSSVSASANSTIRSEVSLFSTASTNSSTDAEQDEDAELSDPGSNEEAYISLFPEYLAAKVEQAIQEMTERSIGRRGASHKTSKEGILAHLQRDDRWRGVGEWSIEEALEYLKDDGRAFVDRGIWRLIS